MTSNTVFKICRFFVRRFSPKYQVCNSDKIITPAVYIVHHQNLYGPVISMAWFDMPIHPWVLHVFCSQEACFRQYYEYTFTKRFYMPKILAAVIAFPVSCFVSVLMRSMQSIPVFRSSKEVIKTFKESVLALTYGESILISPDIDYMDQDSNMREMYKGFLNIEKYYIKQNNTHIAFIPVHIDQNEKKIHIGNAVYFKGKDNFKSEKEEVYNNLKQEFLHLEG
jgi:1-acyl-sn-glycerol-3-phosphate acyltransferase